MSEPKSAWMPDHFEHCMDMLRQGDRERYLTVLFAPRDKRAALAAIYAFNLETARIRDLISEPMPGEIRLQWWREVVTGEREGEGRQHPVGAALLDAIAAHDLPRSAFANLLDARTFDFYNDPMPDRTALEGYLGETTSMLFQLSAQVLNEGSGLANADAAGHAGVAYGVGGLLRSLPLHRHRGQVYIPREMLAAAGTDPDGLIGGADRVAIGQAVAILTAFGREHLARAEDEASRLDKQLRPAFLPLAVVEPLLDHAEKAGDTAAFEPLELSPLRIQWRFLKRAISG